MGKERATYLSVEPWTALIEDMAEMGDQRLDLDFSKSIV